MRDEYPQGPPGGFGLLLSAPAGQFDGVLERWLAVGVEVATVTVSPCLVRDRYLERTLTGTDGSAW
jgi:hypothetical protein